MPDDHRWSGDDERQFRRRAFQQHLALGLRSGVLGEVAGAQPRKHLFPNDAFGVVAANVRRADVDEALQTANAAHAMSQGERSQNVRVADAADGSEVRVRGEMHDVRDLVQTRGGQLLLGCQMNHVRGFIQSESVEASRVGQVAGNHFAESEPLGGPIRANEPGQRFLNANGGGLRTAIPRQQQHPAIGPRFQQLREGRSADEPGGAR